MAKVIVIGAGMGGLGAAIKLQSKGYDVEVYEKLSVPGGKMHQIKDQGHTFDVGPTIVMWPKAYEDVYSNAGKDPKNYIQMKKLDPMYEVVFRGEPNRHYKMSNDLVEIMKTMEASGQETASGFLHYLADIYDRYLVAVNDFITRPFRNKSDIYNPYMMKQALKLKTFNSANNMMGSYISDEDIKNMLAFQTLYIGVSPEQGPSLYNMIPMIELFYGVHYLKGGMHSMALGMAKLFEDLGGKIYYDSPVDEIMITNQKVDGIRVGDAIIESDYVITNADFPYSVTSLIKDEKSRGKYTPEYIDNMDYSCSCLVFYWGIDKEYKDLETHTFVISKNLDKNLKQIYDGSLLEDPSFYLSVPSNGDPDMAPEGKSSFYMLIPVPELVTAKYKYDKETIDYYREKVISGMEKVDGLEDIREHIYLEHIFTPEDFKEKFNAYRGATFGLQPTLKQSAHWRPQSKSHDCEGLYYTGSSTHPGAGVPTAIEGGHICADELILDHEGK